MFKERVKELIKNKYLNFLLILIINIAFFIFYNHFYQLKYEQVDDFMIMNLISKADGSFNIYGVQMHPIICAIIIGLFKTGININWYSIFLLFIQFVSFTVIGTIFLNRNRKIGLITYITFMIIFYSKMLMYIQYTTVAILSITAGFLLLIYSIQHIDNKKKIFIGISILLITIGVMIRFSSIIIAILFIILSFIYLYIKDKNTNNIKIFAIVLILILSVNVSFNIIYKINPIYNNFLEFHDVRTYFHDYNWSYYSNNEEMFKSANWSENDRNMFFSYCFGDEDVFNTENLNILRQNHDKDNNNLFNKVIYTVKEFINSTNQTYYHYALILLLVLVIYNNIVNIKDSKKLIFINLLFFAILGLHCLFIFLGRPMFRVVISIYIIGIATIIYFMLDKEINIRKISTIFLFMALLAVLIFSFKQMTKISRYYNKNDYSVYKEIIEYTSSKKENAYLYTLVLHGRFLAYSVYEKIPDDTFSNIRPLGDWDTYTQNYYDFKEKYNIDNLIKSLYEKDNVYLISGSVIWGESYGDYTKIVIKYIKEHYNLEVEPIVVKEFNEDIKIYKLKKK